VDLSQKYGHLVVKIIDIIKNALLAQNAPPVRLATGLNPGPRTHWESLQLKLKSGSPGRGKGDERRERETKRSRWVGRRDQVNEEEKGHINLYGLAGGLARGGAASHTDCCAS